jgi:zinc protease
VRVRLKSCLLAGSMLAMLVGGGAAAQPVVKRENVWAQAYAGRPADPAVRFGQLPNGVRYAILKNATPKKQAALRLRIGSGSMSERDDQQGLAHFLEHMAFKGSTHVPGGDMVQILQRKGLEFGPDTNAFTAQDETVYQFNLPENDEDSLDTGLMLLREIAGELTLSQAAMDPERGVVLSEERARDIPPYEMAVDQQRFIFDGQLVAQRQPIGKVEILQKAPVSLIRQYYESEYRPEDATVVAVGDFDVDKMEAKIKARFSDWKPKAAGPRPLDLGAVKPRGPAVELFELPGASPQMALSWVRPYDPTADTAARERRDLVRLLALQVLNRRLGLEAQAADAPFIGAGSGRANAFRSADLTQLAVQYKPGAWQAALNAAVDAQRRLVQFGVRQDELDREIAEFRASLTNTAAGASTRQTARLADEIVRAANDDEVFSSPAQDLAEFDADVRGLTAAEVSGAAKELFTGSGPLLFVSSATPIAGSVEAVRTALAAATGRSVSAGAAETAKAWPYASFGPAGKVVSRREIADLGITDVRFANGVRLLVKPTAFSKDQVLVGVRIGSGRLGVKPGETHALWSVGPGAPVLTLGGTKELTFDELQRLNAGKVVGAQLALEDDAYDLSGATRPQDFDTELQLLTAYTARPGMRPQAFERVKAALAGQLAQVEATPQAVLGRALVPALHGGDARFQAVPTAEMLAASTPADLGALLADDLQNGPITVSVVGVVTPDEAVASVARTFGALPARTGKRAPAFHVAFPAEAKTPVVVTHHGRADQAFAFEAWPTTDFFADPQEQRVLGVLSEVMKNRLTDRLRVALGATYSPSADSASSEVFQHYGFLDAVVETPVDKVPGFYAELDKIVADLKAAPVSADELERAKGPRIEQRIKAQQTNGYWSAALLSLDRDPRFAEAIRQLVTGLQKVTAPEVMAAARTYLKDDKAYRLVVRAAPAAPKP